MTNIQAISKIRYKIHEIYFKQPMQLNELNLNDFILNLNLIR